ncbi:MAG TPA: hypothetical protein VFY93_00170 [Planctomycetota bacterium]|nr:hypothetical protein [Planctomycetota bacterium]
MRIRRHIPTAFALLCIAALPLVAGRLRGHVDRCEVDGVALDPAFRVRIEEKDGTMHAFCGITCAEAWIRRKSLVSGSVLVTDGVSGNEVDARSAWFVRTFGNRTDGAPDAIRVFARHEDADRHARAHGGEILVGADRPFVGLREGHAEN